VIVAGRMRHGRLCRLIESYGRRSCGSARRHRACCGVVMSVMLVGGGGGCRLRSRVVTLAYMMRDHLATAVVAAFHYARAQRFDADLVIVVMDAGALGDIVDLGMVDAGQLL
jgi:hypothetical protein